MVLLSALAWALPSANWSIQQGGFIDFHGRQRFFHGVNLIYKSAPYVPLTSEDGPLSFTEQDTQLLQKLGMNVVRLGVMWGGVEPTKGVYNQSYVNEMRKIVRMCEKYNIQVLVEFHQDALAEMFCGEGIPWWAAENYGPDYRNFPAPISSAVKTETRPSFVGSYAHAKVPSLKDCEPLSRSYNDKMASYAAARNYEDLYLNGRGLRDMFVEYWRYLARQFKDDPNVIGFELINEPASIWQRNYTESRFLQPMYDILADAIHEIDPSRIVFFDPVTWDHGYAPTNAAAYDSGFAHPPGGTAFENLSVYAYHYYDYGRLFNGEPFFESKERIAQQLNVVGMVTEFELEPVKTEGDPDDVHFNYGLDLMDANLLSWMAWTYKGYYPIPYLKEAELPFVGTCTGCGSGLYPNLPNDTTISWPTARTLARTYVQAVQGRAKSVKFDWKTSVYKLVYQFDQKVKAPTVIYVSRELGGGVAGRYAQGVEVAVTAGFTWTLEGTTLTVLAKPLVMDCEVSVVVAPKCSFTAIV
jgi:endoglycosylceramidase